MINNAEGSSIGMPTDNVRTFVLKDLIDFCWKVESHMEFVEDGSHSRANLITGHVSTNRTSSLKNGRYRSWIIQSFHRNPSIKEVQIVFPLFVPWRRFLSTSCDRSLSIEENRRHDGFTGSGRCGDRLRQLTFLNFKHY
jgi:hypothetical protein